MRVMADTGRPVFDALLAQARPRALAALVRAFRDLDLAEDLFQDACVKALDTWPARGVPDNPAAWLIRTAHNAGIDYKRRGTRVDARPAEAVLDRAPPDNDKEAELATRIDESAYRDDVLRLMFMCCHKELAVPDQLALALKVVAGLSVAEIAKAFVVAPRAMEQRITRAKKRAAGVATALDVPSREERAERVRSVSTMIYLLFNEGYSARSGDAPIRLSLCDEAIRLARLLLDLFPGQAEVMGLLALLVLQHSRHRARLGPDGELVRLDEQDRGLWDRDLIAEGQVLVEKALMQGQPGPLQVQAAIAAVHCAAGTPQATDWAEIASLYGALEQMQPSPVVTLNRAVAMAKVEGPEVALRLIAPLSDALTGYLPYQAARAGLLAEAGQYHAALAAVDLALGCDPNDAEQIYLKGRREELRKKVV